MKIAKLAQMNQFIARVIILGYYKIIKFFEKFGMLNSLGFIGMLKLQYK